MSLGADPGPEATFWIKMTFLKPLCILDHFRGKRRKGHKVVELEYIGPSSDAGLWFCDWMWETFSRVNWFMS